MNDFDECLAMSHAAEDLPLWREVYEQAFPSMLSMTSLRQDGWWQRAGVDRVLVLPHKTLRIDEKVRGRNAVTGRIYEDFLLEHTSNDRTCAPGWVCKPLLADYIAYAIAPLGKCWLLPVEQLQAAWRKHGQAWLARFPQVTARNANYSTLSTPVPVRVLFPAIGEALRIEFAPCEI